MYSIFLWPLVLWVMSLAMHFIAKILTKKYLKERETIEVTKQKFPDINIKFKENVNEHLLKGYINSLNFSKWFVFASGFFVLIREVYPQWFE